MQIVIAWAEKTKLVPTGRFVTRDLNQFPEFTVAWEGKACIWLYRGTRTDLERARAYAAKEGHEVFAFAACVRDPLAQARKAVVAMAESADR